MSGMVFKFSLKDMGAGESVKQLAERIERPQQMLEEIGVYLMGSVERNFQEGGRPEPWKVSRRAQEQGGQTLRDTGRLQNSITMQVSGNTLKIGTNVVYAAIHNFGGEIKKDKKITVKGHYRYYKGEQQKVKVGGKWFYAFSKIESYEREVKISMPKREFLKVQDDDWPVIKRIGENHLIPVRAGE